MKINYNTSDLNDNRLTSYSEDDILGGRDPYSASKACAEFTFRSYFKSFFAKIKNLNYVTARSGNVIGGGDMK